MIKQLDDDRNLVLVLSPVENVILHDVIGAAITAYSIGLQPVGTHALPTIQQLSSALLLLTDDEIESAYIQPHIDHNDPPESIEAMRQVVRESVAEVRERNSTAIDPTPF